MSRNSLIFPLCILTAMGCVKNDLKDDGISNYEYVYLYTICSPEGDGWPSSYDTIRQIPVETKLSLRDNDQGWSCYKNDDLVFQCAHTPRIYTDVCGFVDIQEAYTVCDDTIAMGWQLNSMGRIECYRFYKFPANVLDGCGECSYSVWKSYWY